jgi:hypothetical protein
MYNKEKNWNDEHVRWEKYIWVEGSPKNNNKEKHEYRIDT